MDMQLWETLETAQSVCSSHSSSVMDAMPTVQDSSPAAECTVLVFDPIPVAKKRKKLGKLWCGLAKLQRRKKHSHLIREAVTDACKDDSLTIDEIRDKVEAWTCLRFGDNRMAQVFFDRQIQKRINMGSKRRRRGKRESSMQLCAYRPEGNPLLEFRESQRMAFEDDLSAATMSEETCLRFTIPAEAISGTRRSTLEL